MYTIFLYLKAFRSSSDVYSADEKDLGGSSWLADLLSEISKF